MASEADALAVDLRANVTQFEKALRHASNEAEVKLRGIERRFEQANGKLNRGALSGSTGLSTMARSAGGLSVAVGSLAGIAGGIGVSALLGMGRAASTAAADVAELDSAIGATFGPRAADIQAWADATGDALGRSSTELKQAALDFQTLFATALPLNEAAEMSKQFAVLAQDLGSYRNVAADVVRQNLFSGLVGETEPLRRYAILINEATVQAKALEMGLLDSNGELSDQNKILVRAKLAFEQTTTAQGDLMRTQSSAANQTAAAKSATRELSEEMGKTLLPITTSLARAWDGLANSIKGALERFNEWNARNSGTRGQVTDLEREIRSRDRRIEAIGSGNWARASFQGGMSGLASMNAGARQQTIDRLQRENAAARQQLTAARGVLAAENAPTAAPAQPAPAPTAPRSTGGGSRAASGPSAEQLAREALDRERRYQDEYFAAGDELLAAQAQLASTNEERASMAIMALDRDKEARRTQLDRMQTDGEISATERAHLDQADRALFATREAVITRENEQAVLADRLEGERQLAGFTASLLGAQSGLARSADERLAIELDLLKLHQDERRRALERAAADETLNHATREAARLSLLRLGDLERAETQGVQQANMGPLDQWRDQSLKTAGEVREAYEAVAARGLDSLNDGIVDAITNAKSLGEAFHDVAQQIIADLARIAVRRGIIEPLANMLFPGGGGAGFGGVPIPKDLIGLFADGGQVRGPGTGTSDSILARLSAGEHVINAKQAARFRPLLEAINSGTLPGFASGGAVLSPTNETGPEIVVASYAPLIGRKPA